MSLPSTLFLEHPTISAINEYLNSCIQSLQTMSVDESAYQAPIAPEAGHSGVKMLLPLLPCAYFTSDMSHPVSYHQEQFV
jgi:hypothetical protein